MKDSWPTAMIVAIVLGFAFLFWLVEFKGVMPSEVSMGQASVKFAGVGKTATPAATPPVVSDKPVSNVPAGNTTQAVMTVPSTTTVNIVPSDSASTSSPPAAAVKPAGLTARQALTKYFQYLADAQPQAAWLMVKGQEQGEKMTYSDYEGFWKAHTDVKWTVTKEYESGNFAWVDLTTTQVEDAKPRIWRYTFRRQTQNPDLKPFNYWGVVGIEGH